MSQSIPRFAYRTRGILVSIPLVVGLITRFNEYENAVTIWAVAGILFAMGLALRIWAQQHLHYRLQVKTVLTTTGPYVLMRNPIYIGNTLICLALTVASEELWLLPITFLNCCLVYYFVVRHEEQILTKAYGEKYLEFMDRVPRWVPKLSALPKAGWTPDFLGISVKAEVYNFLFIIPAILKEYLTRNV